MNGYSVAKRDEAVDWMAQYPGFGEMRWYTDALGCTEVSFSWRSMPPGTGGRGSYGHRHPGQEFYSVHNDTDADVELLLFSTRREDAGTERQDDFWPD